MGERGGVGKGKQTRGALKETGGRKGQKACGTGGTEWRLANPTIHAPTFKYTAEKAQRRLVQERKKCMDKRGGAFLNGGGGWGNLKRESGGANSKGGGNYKEVGFLKNNRKPLLNMRLKERGK